MNVLSRLLTALLSALATLAIVIGALSLALSEGLPASGMAPTEELVVATTAVVINPEIVPSHTELATLAISPSPSPTIFIATSCPVPPGWQEHVVQPGDTLKSLAKASGTTVKALTKANCLLIDKLLPGSLIFVPPATPTSTPTQPPAPTYIPCGPPYGWVRYVVRPGDTLFKLSLELRVSVVQLQWANCLGNSTFILAGDVLYTPFWPPAHTVPPSPAPTSPTPPTSTATQAFVKPTRTSAPPTATTAPPTVAPTATTPPPTAEPTQEPTAEPTQSTDTPIATEDPSSAPSTP